MICADAQVGWFLSWRELVGMDEVQCVCSFVCAVFASLGETSNFFGTTLFPEEFVFSFEELSVFFQFSGFRVEDGI